MSKYVLAIDQGTTSSRAIVFDHLVSPIASHQIEIQQYFPHSGWVEHDGDEIWSTILDCCKQAVAKAKLTFNDILAIGITNQRETTLLWDRESGDLLHRAIVWQDRRTTDYCQQLRDKGYESLVQQRTGLLLDPYFSASKCHWLLENVPSARLKAENGELCFGTIDCFLLWRLTSGKIHATDATNASRTALFNIIQQQWDQELLELFQIPKTLLPAVFNNCSDFGNTDKSLFGVEIPILAMAGDQQAALIGQACFKKGQVKSTYGTGCFLIANTGDELVLSKNKLLSTVAYRLKDKTTYAIEGSIFSAGATMQWLRDGLKILNKVSEAQQFAESVKDNGGVYLVPAFTGLGAPYWNADARGLISGLTRDSNQAHIVRAALEAVAYQTKDLLTALDNDGLRDFKTLRVDGGMVANDWLLQFMADCLQLPVERPVVTETTARGVAMLALLQAGVYSSLDKLVSVWQLDKSFFPVMDESQANTLYNGWQHAIRKTTLLHGQD